MGKPARVALSGRLLETPGNRRPREMTVAPRNRGEQNPAYRPSPTRVFLLTSFRWLCTILHTGSTVGGGHSLAVAGGREPAVEVVCGADERQVREGLGEVAEVLRLWAQLLTVQSQVVGVAKHLLEEEARLL